MIYIILSVLASSAILLIFRWFSSAGINSRHAIMTNYAVASATGLIVFMPSAHWYNQPWFWPSAALGILFYTIFRVMAKTAQENGVAVGVVVTKMSVIIPVIIGLTVLDEGANWFKIVGIICGLAAVFLTTNGHIKGGAIIWPAVLFIGSGIIDSLLNLFQEWSVTEDEFPVFSSTVFAFAFFTAIVHHFILKTERKVQTKSMLGGLLLGVVNFGSIYFLLAALALPAWESSVVFPINNFGIVLLSTIMAMALFKERPNIKNWIGIGLSFSAIWFLYLAK
ncbi:MAG: EamA family transporter [Salibacteraceae bacterium]|nr:EamA family transporter [Salibacteraceae bacterium]MDP4764127.1 EamA family transporter [Salibacteraceae bacterium]MDP4844605.1 EamA family transporter [Salibacteraceae bacterium]